MFFFAYQKVTTKTVVANSNFTANFADARMVFLFAFLNKAILRHHDS